MKQEDVCKDVRPAGWLQALDERLSNRMYRHGTSVPRLVWKVFEYGGDGFLWMFLGLAALLAPASSTGQRRLAANFLLAWAVDLVLVGAAKGTARRPRPVYNQKKDHTVVVAVDHYSFPSGHSSRASFVAGFALVCCARSHPVLCTSAAVWAMATALSRALMGRHYLLDVLAGLVLGALTMAVVTRGKYDPSGFWLDEGHVTWLLAAAAAQLEAGGIRPPPWLVAA